METSQDTTSTKYKISISILFIGLLVVTAITFVPQWRTKVRSFFLDKNRKILSTAEGKLTDNGPRIKVLKIEHNQGLYLEVYQLDDQENVESLLSKIPLNESQDGYFTFKGNATNLALSDIDNDGSLEVLTATYDGNSNPRLSIYKFNFQSQGFDKLNPPQKTQSQ